MLLWMFLLWWSAFASFIMLFRQKESLIVGYGALFGKHFMLSLCSLGSCLSFRLGLLTIASFGRDGLFYLIVNLCSS